MRPKTAPATIPRVSLPERGRRKTAEKITFAVNKKWNVREKKWLFETLGGGEGIYAPVLNVRLWSGGMGRALQKQR